MPPRRSKAAKPASQDRPADSDSDDIVIVAGHEGVPSPLAGTPSPTRVRGAGVSRAAHRVASANLRAKEILAKRQRLGEYTPGAATTDGDAAGATSGRKRSRKSTTTGEGTAKKPKRESRAPDDDPYDLPSDEEAIDQEMLVRREVRHCLDPSSDILMPLLDYQRQFLWWAVTQEKGDMRGGILADEMGMGKTIQALSVICTHRFDDQFQELTPEGLRESGVDWDPAPFSLLKRGGKAEGGEGTEAGASGVGSQPATTSAGDGAVKEEGEEKAAGKARRGGKKKPVKEPPVTTWEVERPRVEDDGCNGEPCCKATLVVCPVVAVVQWRQEISRFVRPGALRVVVYHGPKRGGTQQEELEAADVVITTYSVLEQDYRRFCMPSKVVCPYCSRKYYPDRIKVHLQFFCGPNAHKTEAQAKAKKKGGLIAMKARAMKQRAAAEEKDKGEGGCDKGEEKKAGKTGKGAKKAKGEESGGRGAVKDEAEVGTSKGGGRGKGGRKGSSAVNSDGEDEAKGPSRRSSTSKPRAKAGRGGRGGGRGRGRGRRAASGSDDSDEDFEGGSDSGDSESDWGSVEEEEGVGRGGAKRAGRVDEGSDVEVVGGSGGGAEGEDYDPSKDPVVQSLIQKAESASTGEGSVLHSIRWRRVVLDEAHCIKDRKTNTAQAVFLLHCQYRWALSGTPLQNRVNELFSQVRFMRINPFSYFFCKKCPCKCLDYPFRADWAKCEHCGHGPMQHFCWWNRMVANPIIYQGYQGRGRLALLRLRREVLDRTLLRRTKVQCADELSLPPRTVTLRRERLDETEQDFYEALYTQSKAQFSAFVGEGTLLNNYAHIFDLLIRLRQAVCHPYLVIHSNTQAPVDVSMDDTAPSTPSTVPANGLSEDLCAICHEALEDPVPAECGHAFCRLCVIEYIESIDQRATCPKLGCGRPLTVDLQDAGEGTPQTPAATPATPKSLPRRARAGIMARVDKSAFRTSTKIEALREEIDAMVSADPTAKCLVFSQFTSFLDIIEHRLVSTGIRVVRLTGSMTLPQRDQVISAFTSDPSVTCFLMSLKAGGVALNLTAASHVFLMDPWWNPAVEQQAQDRIHRLGQYKPISVTRIVIAGTIEERILKLQEKKQLVFEGTIGQDHAALGKLTPEDLAFLFH